MAEQTTAEYLNTDEIIEKIIELVQKNSKANTDIIYIAYKLAKNAHKGQFRRSGAPYIEHPVQIAEIAAELGLDTTAIAASLLHDVVEDTGYTYNDIEGLFGTQVAELVDGVTKLEKIQYSTIEEQQVENLRKMFLAMARIYELLLLSLLTDCIICVLLSLCHRISNLKRQEKLLRFMHRLHTVWVCQSLKLSLKICLLSILTRYHMRKYVRISVRKRANVRNI